MPPPSAGRKPGAGEDDLPLLPPDVLQRCRRVAEELSQRLPQTHINGVNNVWIVKPSGKSRGRGIQLFNDLGKLMRYIGPDSNEAKWVVQKYIERPILAHRRYACRPHLHHRSVPAPVTVAPSYPCISGASLISASGCW